jgi:HAD superfamily hydrolase (TIGR01509 family)
MGNQKKLQPQAILFDLDGVLVDSLDAWWISLNSALEAFHQQPLTKKEFISRYWGHDLYDNLDRMNLSHDIGPLCNQMYSEHVDAIRLYPKAKETLEYFTHYEKGVITNTPGDSAHLILQKFGLQQFFDVVLTSDQVQKAKPHPEIVLKACQLLQVQPQQVVLVGDTRSDVNAGRAAGCTVIGVNVEGDYMIKTVGELPSLIK